MYTSNKKLINQKVGFITGNNKKNNNKESDEAIIPIVNKKISLAAEGVLPFYEKLLTERTCKENALAIAEYIIASVREANISVAAKKTNIEALVDLSKFVSQKNFREMIREDILLYLDSLRKPELSDPMHKWIGTYTLRRAIIAKFFKWLYYPTVEPDKRPKPEVIENIPNFKRKEKSIYKPSDIWTQEDDVLFLKYCPSKRDRCYHAISRDLSCRPHEILNLRIKDINFKTSGNYQYTEVLVNGKTGSRSIPLISSIPYVKDWLDSHPQRGNPKGFLITSLSDRSFGRRMGILGLYMIYKKYKNEFFPKLLLDPTVLLEDKQKIEQLLKKPWNPYIRRHSALTEKCTILKEHVLRQHAGWSIGSQMPQKYLHYFGNESSESLLEAYGLVAKGQQVDQLRPKQCPNCNEPNKPDSRFCAKCRMVLTYDAYSETVEQKERSNNDLQILKEQVQTLISALGSMDQSSKNELAKKMYQEGMYVTEKDIGSIK